MEPLAVHPLKYSGPKAKVFAALLSMVLCTVMLFLLQLKFLKPKINSFYAFEVKDAKGRTVSLEKFKGKVSRIFWFSCLLSSTSLLLRLINSWRLHSRK
jgi:glutathione peroxidase